MRMLGIETSCDETSAAVVEETGDPARPWAVRSNVVASQVAIHREWGGVVPELASRQHIRDICGVVERALDDASSTWSDLGRRGRHAGPRARRVAPGRRRRSRRRQPPRRACRSWRCTISPATSNRSCSRTASCRCRRSCWSCRAAIPACTWSRRPGTTSCSSRTRDDAAGEAYDKVAKLLGLGYPGGPVVDRLARGGNDRAVRAARRRGSTHADRNAPHLKGDLDFSFSGLKTAVLRLVRDRQERAPGPLPEQEVADICASFQRVVVTTLVDRAFRGGAPARREKHRRRRRRVGQQPAARRYHVPRRGSARCRRFFPAWRCPPTTRR